MGFGSKLTILVIHWIRVFMTVAGPLYECMVKALFRLTYGKHKPLPPVTDPVLLMSGCDLAAKIRKQELTSEQVVRAYIERTKLVQPYINAAVDERYEAAIQEAKDVDKLIQSGAKSEDELERDTPFLGVPFTCKESIAVKGLSQTCGLYSRKGIKADEDSEVVRRIRKSGAIPYVATNVPELCSWWESANHIYGLTKNPYDHTRTVGGSSGGEGALITSCGAVMGFGSDLAGSIRVPASFCGIYGHKPTPGVVPNKGMWPEDDAEDLFVVVGPMCRYVEDVMPLMKILAGDHKKLKLDEKVDFREVKIYYMDSMKGYLTSSTPDIRKAVRKVAQHFEAKFGCETSEVYLSELEYAFEIWETRLLENGEPSLESCMVDENGHVNLCWEFCKNIFQCSEHTFPAICNAIIERRTKDDEYYHYLAIYKELERKISEMLDGRAIFLFPTHKEPPVHHHTTIPKFPNMGYTAVFNVLDFPACQIPAGFSGDGLPIGVQAIAGKFQDHLTIAAAIELDNVFGGWMSPIEINV